MENTSRFTIELQTASDPISGRLSDERGTTISFTGWLGLAGGLEQLIAKATRSDRRQRNRGPSPERVQEHTVALVLEDRKMEN